MPRTWRDALRNPIPGDSIEVCGKRFCMSRDVTERGVGFDGRRTVTYHEYIDETDHFNPEVAILLSTWRRWSRHGTVLHITQEVAQ